MPDRVASLPLWWVLGSFHSAVLVIAIVRLAYPGGGLAAPLSELNTISGLAVYLALWATTLFTARRALNGLDWLSDQPRLMGAFCRRALRWGAANGVMFLAMLGIAQLVTVVSAPRSSLTFQAIIFGSFIVAVFGTVVAAAVGAVIGVALGAIDIAALRVARALTSSDSRSGG